MNNRNRAKLDAYQRVNAFSKKYQPELLPITEYGFDQKLFEQDVNVILSASGLQKDNVGSNAEHISATKNGMGKTVIKFSIRGRVKATQLANTILADNLSYPLTYITVAPKQTAVERAINLRNILNNNRDILTNISATDIAEIDAAIEAYNNSKDETIIKQKAKKASGTDVLPPTFAEADDALDNMYSLVQSYFADTNPVMVREMQLAMDVISTGVRYTSLLITVLADDTGQPVTGAVVTNSSKQKKYTSDINGQVHIDSHRSGRYNFTISAEGKKPLTVAIDVVRGKETSFTVRLKD